MLQQSNRVQPETDVNRNSWASSVPTPGELHLPAGGPLAHVGQVLDKLVPSKCAFAGPIMCGIMCDHGMCVGV